MSRIAEARIKKAVADRDDKLLNRAIVDLTSVLHMPDWTGCHPCTRMWTLYRMSTALKAKGDMEGARKYAADAVAEGRMQAERVKSEYVARCAAALE